MGSEMPKQQTDASQTPDLERIILSVSTRDWQKVAMIISRTNRECEAKQIAASYEDIAICIKFLRDAGQLESVGDVSNWRHSEVRLPATG
jgi:hypothetical protein